MKFKNILTIAFSFCTSVFFAQQQSLFATYRYNMNLINPSYAGLDRETMFSSTFRNQWTGIKDAPQTQALSFGTPMGSNFSIGVSMIYDKSFIEKQTLAGVDISYIIQIDPLTDLYFGLKAGGNSYNVNTTGLETYNIESDPALNSISQFTPNVGAGVLLNNKKYFVSLSVPALLNTKRANSNQEYAFAATNRPHIYLSGGYNFEFNSSKHLALQPSFMVQYVNGVPILLDFNTMLEIDHLIEIGGTCRTNKTFAGIAGLIVSKLLTIGYAYEISTRNEMASTGNTNEFFLRFKI